LSAGRGLPVQAKKFKKVKKWDQARSHKFIMGGGSCCGVLGAEPPAAGGKGVWGEAPSARRFLQFFNKNNAFLGMFRLKFLL